MLIGLEVEEKRFSGFLLKGRWEQRWTSAARSRLDEVLMEFQASSAESWQELEPNSQHELLRPRRWGCWSYSVLVQCEEVGEEWLELGRSPSLQ